MTRRSRIVLADDHPIVLSGLRNLIAAEADLDLVGEATTGLAALKVIRERQPDIAVLDISMPEINGIVLGRRLAEQMPSVRVLALTLHEDRAYLKQALDAGIRGYVLKRSAAEILVQAIRAVIIGGLYLDPAIADRLFDARLRRAGRPKVDLAALDLTDREAEILKLVALGFSMKDIARQLDIGVKSVETYKARGSERLGLRNRAELVRYAAAEGWLADL
jgi:DNA-binding NarL/FixJ family response regulator